MARGKVQIRRIENPIRRQITFCKRRAGLLKKAKELSVLCDADIAIIIFATDGKLYELATKGSMQDLLDRYDGTNGRAQAKHGESTQAQIINEEIPALKKEVDLLEKCLRYMAGEGAVVHMTLDELSALERHLEIWMYHVQSIKMQTLFQEIQLLTNKVGILKAANEHLQEKIIEKHGIFDIAPIPADNPYPVTVSDEIFQF